MHERTVYSEHPEATQWEMLMQYSYESNVTKELLKRGVGNPGNLSETIAGAFSQAYEYFHTASASSLYISPLLVYYGMVNLLSGACQIMSGSLLNVVGHGMSVQIAEGQALEHLSGVTILPSAKITGSLSVFGQTLDPGWNVSRSGNWTLGELLGRMPDLYDEFCDFYEPSSPSLIPVKRGTNGRVVIDRIEQDFLDKYPQVDKILETIPGLSSGYLRPLNASMRDHSVVLYRKPGVSDIALRAMSGSYFLCMGNGPAHTSPVPTQAILLYMAFFALSFLSRYRPELWNPFVKTDSTGERRVFAKSIDVAIRIFPNLVLNRLLDYSVEFNPGREQPEAIEI